MSVYLSKYFDLNTLYVNKSIYLTKLFLHGKIYFICQISNLSILYMSKIQFI